MNETKVYADGYQAAFSEEESFLNFLGCIGSNSKWLRNKVKNLRVVVLPEKGELTEKLKAQYAKEGKEDIITDTIQGTGLALKTKEEYIPLRKCSIKSILDRAGISGSGLKRVEKNVYARILNDCLKVAKGEALIRYSEGKVSAVLGGDHSGYSILDMEQIFMHTARYLTENYKECKFLGGFYEHDMVSALWELHGEDKLLEAYKKELKAHWSAGHELTPVIRVTTSDTGSGGANIYPLLMTDKRGLTVSLGSPLRLHHRSGASITEFDEQLKMLYGKYQLAIGNLTKLLNIEIQNPVNCMIVVMKKLGISQKYTMEAVELYKAQCGEDPCTAHDIYYGISEVIYMLECEGEEGSKVAKMEETVARALSINWIAYDIPGEVKW